MQFSPKTKKIGDILLRFNMISAGWTAGERIFSRPNYLFHNCGTWWLKHTRYAIPNGDYLMLEDFLNGRITGDQFAKLAKDPHHSWANFTKKDTL
jgi:hypothetical protein